MKSPRRSTSGTISTAAPDPAGRPAQRAVRGLLRADHLRKPAPAGARVRATATDGRTAGTAAVPPAAGSRPAATSCAPRPGWCGWESTAARPGGSASPAPAARRRWKTAPPNRRTGGAGSSCAGFCGLAAGNDKAGSLRPCEEVEGWRGVLRATCGRRCTEGRIEVAEKPELYAETPRPTSLRSGKEGALASQSVEWLIWLPRHKRQTRLAAGLSEALDDQPFGC